MTDWSAAVYKQLFGEDAPWSTGTDEERRAAWQRFQAQAEAVSVSDEDFVAFEHLLHKHRESSQRETLFQEDAA